MRFLPLLLGALSVTTLVAVSTGQVAQSYDLACDGEIQPIVNKSETYGETYSDGTRAGAVTIRGIPVWKDRKVGSSFAYKMRLKNMRSDTINFDGTTTMLLREPFTLHAASRNYMILSPTPFLKDAVFTVAPGKTVDVYFGAVAPANPGQYPFEATLKHRQLSIESCVINGGVRVYAEDGWCEISQAKEPVHNDATGTFKMKCMNTGAVGWNAFNHRFLQYTKMNALSKLSDPIALSTRVVEANGVQYPETPWDNWKETVLPGKYVIVHFEMPLPKRSAYPTSGCYSEIVPGKPNPYVLREDAETVHCTRYPTTMENIKTGTTFALANFGSYRIRSAPEQSAPSPQGPSSLRLSVAFPESGEFGFEQGETVKAMAMTVKAANISPGRSRTVTLTIQMPRRVSAEFVSGSYCREDACEEACVADGTKTVTCTRQMHSGETVNFKLLYNVDAKICSAAVWANSSADTNKHNTYGVLKCNF